MNKWLLVLADGQSMLIDPVDLKGIAVKLALKNDKFAIFRIEDGKFERLVFGILEPKNDSTGQTKTDKLVAGFQQVQEVSLSWLPVTATPGSTLLTLIDCVEISRNFRVAKT